MSSHDYTERNLFLTTGETYYIRIVRRSDSKIWDPSNKVMKAVGDISWANSAIALVEQGSTGVFPVVIPMDRRTVEQISYELYGKRFEDLTDAQKTVVGTAFSAIKNIPGDTYDVTAFKQAGGSPANSDTLEKEFEVKIGDILGF